MTALLEVGVAIPSPWTGLALQDENCMRLYVFMLVSRAAAKLRFCSFWKGFQRVHFTFCAGRQLKNWVGEREC